MKFQMPIDKIHMEGGDVFQILQIGPSFCFMKSRKQYKTHPVFWHKIKIRKYIIWETVPWEWMSFKWGPGRYVFVCLLDKYNMLKPFSKFQDLILKSYSHFYISLLPSSSPVHQLTNPGCDITGRELWTLKVGVCWINVWIISKYNAFRIN